MVDRSALEIEADRILDALSKAGLTVRLVGSMAVLRRCPIHASLASSGRVYRDIDLAGRKKEARNIHELLNRLGYVEDREVFVVSEGGRAIFASKDNRFHVDVFYEKLDFCHPIPLDDRLHVDAPTLPLAELLLSKTQIVKITEKDIADVIALLLEHKLGDDDADQINVARIAKLCAEDWGLWRTTTINLEKIERFAETHPSLDQDQKARIAASVAALRQRIDAEPKPLAWRMRAKIGERVKWYNDVEEVRF
ncbi:MAG TPA: hypothetical protein VHK01_02745 [Lacipirellulaceae bacterium]|jgi:hypothetical protein|nr:hypothetical protein [Lacipirellulaceae bacterium]